MSQCHDSGRSRSPALATARSYWIVILVTLTFATAARAQQQPGAIAVDLNPTTTAIHWTLNTTVHTVHGIFRLKSGTFRVDPATGQASGQIVIDATSAESGDGARDKVLHKDVLQSARYPEITFRPIRIGTEGKGIKTDSKGESTIDLIGASTVTVEGLLNLRGEDHPIQLLVTLGPPGTEPQGTELHLTTHFKVPYVAWGLKDPSMFLFRADKEVALDVDLAAPVH
jgi:polyisoprenoid-binding protein YceI